MRLSVQGVKSLVNYFACLCREFDFYKVKRNEFYHYFSKRKEKYSFLIILIVKSLQKEHKSLHKCVRLDLHTAAQSFILTDSSPLCFFVMKNVEIQLLENLRLNTFDFLFKFSLIKQVSS